MPKIDCPWCYGEIEMEVVSKRCPSTGPNYKAFNEARQKATEKVFNDWFDEAEKKATEKQRKLLKEQRAATRKAKREAEFKKILEQSVEIMIMTEDRDV